MTRGVWLATCLAVAVLAVPGVSPAGPVLPTAFEANRGQTDASVKFLARDPGFTLFITESEGVLVAVQSRQVVRLRLVGARQTPDIVGLEPLPGRSHYFRGRNPANWLTDIPTYALVAYRDAYPGIDAAYRASGGTQLEQEFVVRPGAEAAVITLQFDGVGTLAVDAAGDLVLTTPTAPVRLSRPIAYQDIDGARRTVAVAWVVRGPRKAGFELGPYDREHPLVIDPFVVWSTRLGGTGEDQAFGVAADSFGNVYVTGDTASANFPTVGASTLGGGVDAFVTKLDSNGQFILYSAFIGGTGTDAGRGIAVDSNFNAYVTGFTNSPNFPTTTGAFQPSPPQGDFDAFVVKLGPNGAIAYSTLLGGTGADTAFGIAVDSSGRAHVAGGTRSLNFPLANALQSTPGGGTCLSPPVDCRDAFVTRLSPQGNVLEYSTFLGGSNDDTANAIALDGSGRVYVTGTTLSTDFPTTPGSLQRVSGLGTEAFVARVDADGSLGWSTFLGGVGADVGNGIAVNNAGSPVVVGSTTSTNFPATGPDVFTGLTEGFVTRLNASGSALLWSRGTSTAIPTAVAIDSVGDVQLVANQLVCTDPSLLPPGCPQSHIDVVVNKRSGVTGVTLDIVRFGGSGDVTSGQDLGQAIAAFSANIWVAGSTVAANFPTTPNTAQPAAQGGTDAFVVKFSDLTAGVPVEGSDDSCVIATAAFGSPLAAEVQTLRRFRDRALLTNALGRLLVRAYYRTSPPLARVVAREPVLAATVRGVLRPVALGAGFTLTHPFAAAGLIAVGLVVIVGLWARKRHLIARLSMVIALLGGALVVGVFERTPTPSTTTSEPAAPTSRGREASAPRQPLDNAAATSSTSVMPRRISDLSLTGADISVTLLDPFAPPAERRWAVSSVVISGILSTNGFLVTDAGRARGLGIRTGDMIVSIDNHPPTGLLAVLTVLQRDPDRATVVLEIDRGGNRLVQSYRVR